MEHVGPNELDFTAVPFLDRIFCEYLEFSWFPSTKAAVKGRSSRIASLMSSR